jgi:hypothetical protein
MQLLFTQFGLNAAGWSDRDTVRSLLLGAGATLYLALVGAMLYTIVVLIHSDEQPPPFTRAASAQPVVLTLPMLQLNADSCLRLASAEQRQCDDQAHLEAVRQQVKKRIALHIHSMRTATGNLLWAPPGAVLMAEDSAHELQSGEKLLESALLQARTWGEQEVSSPAASLAANPPAMLALR